MSTKWGIAGSGKIANDFATALRLLPKSEHEIVAVAASQLSRAEEFAKKHEVSTSYGAYVDLAKDPSVEVVYIGLLNPQHFETCRLMLEHGKHVLCEKPLCLNARQAKTIVELARKKGLFLMEAIWSRFFPVYKEVRRILENNEIGEVLHMTGDFGVKISDKERLKLRELGGGTVLDIGIYLLQAATMVFGLHPTTVSALGHLNEEGVDISVGYLLKYPNGAMATLTSHARIQMKNTVVIYGTKGTIEITEPFWCPTSMVVNGQVKSWDLPGRQDDFHFTNSAGLSFEAQEVRRCLKEGLIESPFVSHEESIAIATLEDTVRQQIGVVYAQDSI